MNVTRKDLEKSQVELTIEVGLDELKPYLESAAAKITQKNPIPGFRPGKAPMDMVKQKFGEMTIWQNALDAVVQQTFYKTITDEKLMTVGQPEINIDKFAPGNPIVYKAKVALLPEVNLGDWEKLSVEEKKIEVNEEDMQKTMDQLTQMNVKETIADRPAKKGDKVEVDFEVSINNAVIEGGKNPKYPIVLGEGKMIPGFEDKIIGKKAGEETSFKLNFPEKYFQKNVAGKEADFKVKVLNVFERDMPKVDDEFAKKLGFETLDKLKEQISNNIKLDKENKEKQRVESEAVRAIVKKAEIKDIPDVLVKNEVHKMAHELEHSIMQQGMDMAGYLKSINKTQEDLEKDFRPQATERVQAALIMRQIAIDKDVKATDEEVQKEIKLQEEMYAHDPNAMQNIRHPQYAQHVRNSLINQKVIKLISEKIIK